MFVPTADELNEVRMGIHTRLKPKDLSDEQIKSSMILGSAVDYVLGELLDDIDLSVFDETKRQTFLMVKDGMASSLTSFESTCLEGAQVQMFRRAVIYRATANAYPMVKVTDQEVAFDLTKRYDLPDQKDKLTWLMEQVDLNIIRLRNLFPTDAYPDVPLMSALVGVL